MPTISASASRPEVAAILGRLVLALTGQATDPWGVVQGLQLRVGNVLLSKIRQDFVVKAQGGTGEDGIKWPPLKRETIAQRRTTAAERKALGIGGKRVRGLLTPAQDKRWRMIFATRRNWLIAKFGMGDREASARAAQIAWSILKAEGAKTKLEVLGGRTVEMLRDTGELYRSLSPGVEDQPSRADGQILRLVPGRVTVGTNKKPWHHLGVPGKLPARHLWPPDGQLPDAWWDAILSELLRGSLKAVEIIMARAA